MKLNKENNYLILITIAFFALGILRINDLSLYNDCTRYLIWGNSIAQGKGYVDDTQPDPQYFVVNAPLFPLILAPVLIFFPFSLYAAKIWSLILGTLSVFLFNKWLRMYFKKNYSLSLTLLYAFYPLTIIFYTEVLSESIFVCSLLITFIIIEHFEKNSESKFERLALVIIISFIVLLREVGISLVVAVVIFLIYKRKWQLITISIAGCILIFSAWTYRNIGLAEDPSYAQHANLIFIFRNFVTPQGTSITQELLQRLITNFKDYQVGLSGMLIYYIPFSLIVAPSTLLLWTAKFLYLLGKFIFIVFLPMLVYGIWKDSRSRKTYASRVYFLFIYLLIVIIYPVKDVRFIFPLIPLIFFYLGLSSRELAKKLKKKNYKIILGTLSLVIILVPNLISLFEVIRTNIIYTIDPVNFPNKFKKGKANFSYYSTPWKILGDSIDKKIEAGTIIAIPRKEIVSFAPKQKFIELNCAVPVPQFESLLRNYGVDYIIAPTLYDSITEYQIQMDELNRFTFELCQKINNLNLFKIYPKHQPYKTNAISKQLLIDTTSALGLLRLGRHYLKNELYPNAIYTFNKLLKLYPKNPEIRFQFLLIKSFQLDTVNIADVLKELYSLPSSTSYNEVSQLAVKIMKLRLQARQLTDSPLRAGNLLEAGRICWQLGYPKQAYRIIRESIREDSTFIPGYLWAWHYGTQLGDRINTTFYLNKLETLDKNNPVFQSFKQIAKFRNLLTREKNKRIKSNIHIMISREYDRIELFEEALDEAQLAIDEDRTNKEAWYNLSELFKKKNLLHAYENVLRQTRSAILDE